jgi:FkbM family methyltransferase
MTSLLRKLRHKVGNLLHPKPKVGAVNHSCATVRLGTDYGGWAICPDSITKNSIVYSFGIGEDISFDLALIKRFGCTVHAFDPTPRSLEWCRKQSLPPQFVLHDFGLADRDGTITFFAPENPTHVSHSTVHPGGGASVTVPVRSLSTIMKDLGHSRLDILKMDIEGSEYAVLEQFTKDRPDVAQLLVEFHHRFPEVGPAKTEASLDALGRAGYKLFCISDSLEEYSFIRA